MTEIKSEGQLFDVLQKRFGVGDYDDGVSTKPFYRVRMTEISKIKAMMRKRGVRLPDLVIALDYAIAERKPIQASWELFGLVTEAKQALRAAEKAAIPEVRDRLVEAAGEAHRLEEFEWAARLYSADNASGEAVLVKWAEHLERSTT